MSRERARRRAERQALAEREKARRADAQARRDRRRVLVRRLTPRRPDRRTGLLFARRSRGERAGIAVAVVLALLLIWILIDSLPLRVGLTALAAVAAPALIVIALDRRT